MARTNNLTNFLTDVAGAIKEKKGSEANIPAANFDTEIRNLPSQGTYEEKTISITQNGTQTVTPSQGYDAIDELTINANVQPSLQSKSYSFTQNTTTTITPEQGYDGFSSIGLEINVPSSTINNQDKTITENGTYTADTGYTGLGAVTVNVSSGSGDVKLFDTVEHMQADPDAQEGDLAVVYKMDSVGITAQSRFSKCIFPNTVVLDSAYAGEADMFDLVFYGGSFRGEVTITTTYFEFIGEDRDTGEELVNIRYTSQDAITYTRTDGGNELIDFGSIIQYDETYASFFGFLSKFMRLMMYDFEGLYKCITTEINNEQVLQYVLADTQLTAATSDVYGKTFYGKNGVETGNLGVVDNTFADTTASIIYNAQQQYETMTIRILTDQDKTIDTHIYFIPTKRNGIPLLDTSNVTDMYDMFSGCTNLISIPLLDTSNVTTMENMFYGCTNLTSVPLLDTSNVTNMAQMFTGCTNLTSVPLLDTSNVTNMAVMFDECTNLTSVPLLDTSNVTDMGQMFTSCTNLTSVPLLDTSNVEYMYDIFYECTSLSNTSLNNILAMCANATSYTETKTLRYLFGDMDMSQEYPVSTIQGLSNYSAFTTAGWSIGW